MIRKATGSDIDAISEIYERVHDETENGNLKNGWKRNIYPTRTLAESSVKNEEMFVFEENGKISACARINSIQDEAYKKVKWNYEAPDDKITVLHTLAVLPSESGKGIGTSFVKYYEEYAKQQGRPYLRIDTNEINHAARKLYNKLGYTEAGIIKCVFNGLPDINLVCLEKFAK